jgi:hypothetical protein
MKRLLALAASALLAISFLHAEDATENPPLNQNAPAPVTDPAQVSKHFQEVLAQPQYQETEDATLNSRVEDWLSQWFKRLGTQFGDFKYSSRMPAFESLLMTMLVTFSIAVLLYIMVRLTRRRAGMEPEPLTGSTGEKTFRAPESYDTEIQQAIHDADWHTAWLASWRQFLSRLEHRHLVAPDRTRTNREYLAQLLGKPLPASAFNQLNGMVDAYDQFIYGRKSIAESDWDTFHRQIDETALLLHLERKPAGSKETGSAS